MHRLLVSLSAFWVLGLFSTAAFAVSEAQYESEMNSMVRPFYATGVDGSFPGVGGTSVRYRKWDNPHESGIVVIFPGRAEAYEMYAETIYDLAQKGYSVYAMDERGQGASERILKNPELGYVEHFSDYLTDAKSFFEQVVNTRPHLHRFILAHSMGGAIATLYADAYPNDYDALALVSPMFQINTAPYAHWEAGVLAFFNVLLGKGPEYAPTQHDWNPEEKFEKSDLTDSEVRWQNRHQILLDHPELRLGGATNRWVKESMKAGKKIRRIARHFEAPVLLELAGKDTVVEDAAEENFCQKAQRCTEAPVYPDSKHNILAESDTIRVDAMARILQFFSEN